MSQAEKLNTYQDLWVWDGVGAESGSIEGDPVRVVYCIQSVNHTGK